LNVPPTVDISREKEKKSVKSQKKTLADPGTGGKRREGERRLFCRRERKKGGKGDGYSIKAPGNEKGKGGEPNIRARRKEKERSQSLAGVKESGKGGEGERKPQASPL